MDALHRKVFSLGGCANCSTVMPIPYEGGTIMSYCDVMPGVGVLPLGNGFGTQPGNYMRARIANASCLNNCDTECAADVTISGTGYPGLYYNIPLTESSTWIKTNGPTKVLGGIVKLDANGSSYVELNPGFEATYDYASTNSVFIAEAHDGCTTGTPSFMSKSSNDFKSKIVTQVEKNVKTNSFTVYPNPATGYFTLVSAKNLQNAKIELFDVSGKLQKITIKDVDIKTKKVIVSYLSKGMYLVKLTVRNQTEFAKVMIQ